MKNDIKVSKIKKMAIFVLITMALQCLPIFAFGASVAGVPGTKTLKKIAQKVPPKVKKVIIPAKKAPVKKVITKEDPLHVKILRKVRTQLIGINGASTQGAIDQYRNGKKK
jgi:hypothetical protein